MAHKRYSLGYKKELYYISLIIIVGGILLLSIFGPNGYLELKRVRREMLRQQERVEALKQSNNKRMETIESLRSDMEAIERYAREQGYGRENEIIERLPEEQENESADTPPESR